MGAQNDIEEEITYFPTNTEKNLHEQHWQQNVRKIGEQTVTLVRWADIVCPVVT